MLSDLKPCAEVIFFTYIGFNIAAFAFLCQYLNFPRSILTDLSNIKSQGFPRIPHSIIEDMSVWKNSVIYFFEVDLLTFALLMYLILSLLIALLLTAIKLDICPQVMDKISRPIVIILVIIYVLLRAFSLWQGAFRKKNKKRRGEPLWSIKAKWCYVLIELLITMVFIITTGYGLYIASGKIVFLSLILTLILFLIWYLVPTFYRNPVTNLFELWNEVGRREDAKVRYSRRKK